jgi:hypothetical protein
LQTRPKLGPQFCAGGKSIIKSDASRDAILGLLLAHASAASASQLGLIGIGVLIAALLIASAARLIRSPLSCHIGSLEEAGQVGGIGTHELARLAAAAGEALVPLDLGADRCVALLRPPRPAS